MPHEDSRDEGSRGLPDLLEAKRGSTPPQNEQSAKQSLILPILRELGWDIESESDVLYEHKVGGKAGGFADIALRSPRRVLAIIEAKKPQAKLADHVTQVLGYAFHEGVDICVLTNGLEWWLYLPREKGDPDDRRFAVLNIATDPIEQLSDLFSSYLGKENLRGSKAEEKAEEALIALRFEATLAKKLPLLWRTMLNEPDGDLVELIRRRAQREFSLLPSAEQVASILWGKHAPTPPPPPAPAREAKQAGKSPALSPAKPRSGPSKPGRKPSVKPTAVVIFGKRHEVTNHKAAFCWIVDTLYRRHPDDFHRATQVKSGKSTLARHDSGGIAAPYRVATSGYFVETHGNAAALRGKAIRFLELFGHTKADIVYETDS